MRVELLVRHSVLRGEALVARKIDLRALQRGFVARELAALLGERRLIGPRIDLRKQIALLDLVAFLEDDLDQVAGNLGADGDGGERRHGPERIEVDADIALADRLRNDRHRRATTPSAARIRLRRALVAGPPDDAGYE